MRKVLLVLILVSSCFGLKQAPVVPRIGFRVEEVGKDKVLLRPIYPAKFSGELLEGLLPAKGEMLTCSVHDEEMELKAKDSKTVWHVHKMVLYCLSGQKVVVIGVEY